LSLDESLALRTAASRLVGEFAGVFGAEMIERFLHPSFDQFAPLMVITMGCGDACPIFPGNVTRNGFSMISPGGTCPASDPFGDEIERRVRNLLQELELPVAVFSGARPR